MRLALLLHTPKVPCCVEVWGERCKYSYFQKTSAATFSVCEWNHPLRINKPSLHRNASAKIQGFGRPQNHCNVPQSKPASLPTWHSNVTRQGKSKHNLGGNMHVHKTTCLCKHKYTSHFSQITSSCGTAASKAWKHGGNEVGSNKCTQTFGWIQDGMSGIHHLDGEAVEEQDCACEAHSDW